MSRKKWTKSEDELLIKEFPVKTNKELAEIFNRSEKSIIQHAHTLKLHKNKQSLWTDHEIEFLNQHYNVDLTPSDIAKKLNRSVSSVKSKAFAIGLADNVEWTQEQIDYLIDNYCYKTNEEIGKKIGRSGQAVSYKAFELSLSINENWSDNESNIVKTNYLNKTMNELQELLPGKTKGDILAYCHKLGLTRTKKTCIRDFFNVIDTEEKAYWLGFIFADGYISFSESNMKKGQLATTYCTGIKLQWSDRDHLKKFNKSINGNYKVFKETCHPDGFRKKTTEAAKILVYSQQMYNDLNKYFDRDKTYTAKFPNIPGDLIRHFIRGYFDGDGCFTFTEKTFDIDFLGASKDFHDGLKDILLKYNFNFNTEIKINQHDTSMYYIHINKNLDKCRFLDWIYSDCHIYLDRKYEKYLKCKNYKHSIWPRHIEICG
jgi:DNA-binding CsgD family transcriptional regulator